MKKIKFIIMIFAIFLLTGCSDYRELSDMAIVSSLGIDKIDEKYYVISQILDSKMKSEEDIGTTTPEIIIYESYGKTLHEALRNTMLESPKKLYLGHIETVLISEYAAKNGISDFFDFFLRDAEASKDFNIIVARDYKIKEIMDILTPLETIPAENISSSIEIGAKLQGSIDNVTFDKFVSNVLRTGIDAVLPIVTIKKVESDNEEIDPEKRLKLENEMAIFSKDKLIGYINESATLGYNLINSTATANVIPFKCNKDKFASMELVSNNSNMSFDIKTNTIKIEIKLKGALSELDCDLDIKKEKNIKKIQEEINNEIKKIANETIDEAIKYNTSDFLGIGEYIFQNENKYYKKNKRKINETIKNMKRNVKVSSEFIQKGSIKEGDEKY